NHENAFRLAKAAAAKAQARGGACEVGYTLIADLNSGGKEAVGNPGVAAYTAGAAAAAGQVGVAGMAGACPASGEGITLNLVVPSGTVLADDFPSGYALAKTFTAE
ncbi:MAG: hypothetical protein JSW10_07750, partial [Pseudomonadota bacterium]